MRREKRKRAKALQSCDARQSEQDPLADLLADEPVAGGDKLPAINIPPIKMDAADPENWAMGSEIVKSRCGHFRKSVDWSSKNL